MSWMDFGLHLAGIALLAAVAVVYKFASGGSFSQLVEGKDGRASTSKFQPIFWQQWA